jgi:hypothetical protein
MMAHFAIRSLMHEAAVNADEDPDKLSFIRAVRVVRRKVPAFGAISPRKRRAFHNGVLDELLQERVVSSRNRRNPRGVKRKMSNFPLRRKGYKPLPPINIVAVIRILK